MSNMRESDRRLCDQIRKYRKRCGFTQVQLASAVGVSKNAVSSWERYEYIPSVPHICMLTSIFNCTLNELCCWSSLGVQ